MFQKKIGRYNQYAEPVVYHLFNKIPKNQEKLRGHFPQIDNYWLARSYAIEDNIEEFKKLIYKLPWRVMMGFRNSYKLDIDKSEIMGKAKMSDKEELQLEAAVKRSGAKKRKIDYKAQDIYDLWKALYFKVYTDDSENIEKISEAIEEKMDKIPKIDLGDKCSVVLDASHSMYGSEERPLHPILTGLCIIPSIKTVKDVFIVSGKWKEVKGTTNLRVVMPANSSPLWRGLVDAVISGAKTIVVISDGYENAVKGMFDHVYKHFKRTGREFNLIHINPVFSADSKSGTARTLAEDITPMPVENYKYLETEFIFNQMIENTEVVKQLLIQKYKKLIGG
jgi:hypothetical protein